MTPDDPGEPFVGGWSFADWWDGRLIDPNLPPNVVAFVHPDGHADWFLYVPDDDN